MTLEGALSDVRGCASARKSFDCNTDSALHPDPDLKEGGERVRGGWCGGPPGSLFCPSLPAWFSPRSPLSPSLHLPFPAAFPFRVLLRCLVPPPGGCPFPLWLLGRGPGVAVLPSGLRASSAALPRPCRRRFCPLPGPVYFAALGLGSRPTSKALGRCFRFSQPKLPNLPKNSFETGLRRPVLPRNKVALRNMVARRVFGISARVFLAALYHFRALRGLWASLSGPAAGLFLASRAWACEPGATC